MYFRDLLLKENEIREFIFYFYAVNLVDTFSSEEFYVTIGSCIKNTSEIIYKKEIKLNVHLDLMANKAGEVWFPVYVDNADWRSIEFVCSIEIKFFYFSIDFLKIEQFKNFKYVIK